MKFFLSNRFLYTLVGLILGLGSPAGYLLLLYVFQGEKALSFIQVLKNNIMNNQLTLAYMTFGTCLVFGIFGYLLGARDDTLGQKNLELEKSSEQKDDYLNICSHDIKSPLTIMSMAARMLIEGRRGELTKRQEEMVSRIRMQAESTLNLVSDLMSLARLEAPTIDIRPSTLEASDLLNQSIQDLSFRALEKSVTIDFINPEEQILFEGDNIRIRQLIRNLLDNAIKFTPENGRIKISTATACLNDNNSKKINRYLQIAISDSGVGIAQEKLNTIFDKYQQSRERDRTQGTGLGLAICKGIAQLHGGKLWAESEEGKGSVFYCRIPLTQRASQVSLK